MTQNSIKMQITSNVEYVSIVRLTASGIANHIGFDMDDIEDLKVAISEACANAIKHSEDSKVVIEFRELENGLEIEIIDEGKGYDESLIEKPNLDKPKENGLGLFIIEALMDEVRIESFKEKGTSILMRKYLGVDK